MSKVTDHRSKTTNVKALKEGDETTADPCGYCEQFLLLLSEKPSKNRSLPSLILFLVVILEIHPAANLSCFPLLTKRM